jgi:hypothetical protein
LTWTVGSITLPQVNRATEGCSIDGTKTLTVEGDIYVAGQTKAQLETNYINPLLAYRAVIEVFPIEGNYPIIIVLTGSEVAINGNGKYTGTYWVMRDAQFTEVAEGTFARFTFILSFVSGSSHVIL